MNLTADQRKVVDTRKKDILVSAAAGSGKTAVLIQRILSRITDAEDPIDVDRLLIVTFTKAAAAEMRERLHKAILEALEKEPENDNLQRQATLIHNAQITTIDSFCLFILRNHFHEINLDPAFRIGDPGEVKLIEKQVLIETLEEFYVEGGEDFLAFSDAYCPNGNEDKLEELVEQLYHYSMSHPWPLEWLNMCKLSAMDLTEESICQMEWMKYGWSFIKAIIHDCILMAKINLSACEKPGGPYQYAAAVEADLKCFEGLLSIAEQELTKVSYEQLEDAVCEMKWATLSRKSDPSVAEEQKQLVKDVRDRYKKLMKDLVDNYLDDPFSFILKKEQDSVEMNAVLIDITERFIQNLAKTKKEKNLIDFSDAEHYALSILCENGKPTNTALSYQEYFKEVMIDEYQDSNMVQELLLSSIANKNEGMHDRFMVGDMKQSIYRFRLACPAIFLDKYKEYQSEDEENTLINLKMNFRSREQVLDSVNEVFYKIMKPEVGDVLYDQDAALYLGANFGAKLGDDNPYRTELMLLETDGLKSKDAREVEALMIAKKIKSLVGIFQIVDTQKSKNLSEGEEPVLRKVNYRDIVILTRSETNVTSVLRSVLMKEGIPVHVTSKNGYFTAQEVSTLMDLLRVINNPYEDIPFCSAMLSVFFQFTESELAMIRAEKKAEKSLYEAFLSCVRAYQNSCDVSKINGDEDNEECKRNESGEDTKLSLANKLPAVLLEKMQKAISDLNRLRQKSIVLSMPDLVQEILTHYHYLEYVTAMPAGQQRCANVEMFVEKTVDYEKTSFHGLFQFIRYMEQLKKYEVDYGEASILAETADVVRIMTIHKSKGLEFPICFVAGMERRFNTKDTSNSVLIDVDWGVASEYMDLENRIKGKTLRRNLLAQHMKRESLGEELRVFYVAMTRAKEKLILTATVDSVEKATEKYGFLRYADCNCEIPGALLASASSYLDYVMMTYPFGLEHFDVKSYTLEELGLKNVEEEVDLFVKKSMLEKENEFEGLLQKSMEEDAAFQSELGRMQEKLSFVYPHRNLETLRAKTSVSELKKAAMEEAGLHPQFETDVKGEPYYPGFAKGPEEKGGTQRGSAYHRALELLDFAMLAKLYQQEGESKEKILKQIKDSLIQKVEKGLLSQEYFDLLSFEKLLGFVCSDFGLRMAKAQENGKLKKEQPFVLAIEATRLNSEFPPEEHVLIQGIIDVFFEEDGEIVILDYKTDRIDTMQALLERYRTQLDYYEEAVFRITGKRVKEKVLYSFAHMDGICWK